MSEASNASHLATRGSDSGLRYISNPLLSHGMANIEIYTQHALRSYLQDKQAHEKLALKLQVATANENARQDEDKTKEKPRSPEA